MSAKGADALRYAQMGLRVFPVAKGSKGSIINGRSGQLLKSWKDEATTDRNRITEWWSTWPDADVCIATGNGLLVIDLDVKGSEDGTESLFKWISTNGLLPRTATVKTKSGGQHHYYFVDGTFPNSRGLYPGIDIRSDGGYVVAPPSDGYIWADAAPIANADQAVYDFLAKKDIGARFELPAIIPEGCRDDTLFKYAASLQAKGLPDEAIAEAVEKANYERCVPPLDDAVVHQKVKQVLTKYPKGRDKGPAFKDVRERKDGTLVILPTIENTQAMLEYEGYVISHDVVLRDIRIVKNGKVITIKDMPYDGMLSEMSDWYLKLGQRVSTARLHEQLINIQSINKYNAPIEYLKGCRMIYGDGAGGIQGLVDCLQFANSNPIYAILIRKWLCQCVAMPHNNAGNYGADGVLVLCGPQGIGKTTFCRKCCPLDEYFIEGAMFLNTRESSLSLTKAWIVEFGELPRSLKDNDSLKAFITQSCDVYRAPYGKKEERNQRVTSFCATVNDKEFLRDESNRRFWVLDIEKIDREKLNQISFEKVYAEAYDLFLKHGQASFRLTYKERKLLDDNNMRYYDRSNEEVLIIDRFDWEQPSDEWKEYTASAIADLIGGNTKPRNVGKALNKIIRMGTRPISRRAIDGVNRYKMPRLLSIYGTF